MIGDKHDDGGPLELAQQREMTWIQHACKERDMYHAALAPVAHHGINQVYQASEQVSQWVIELMIDKKRSELLTCQLSLIQSETQAITPSKIRLQSENIAPISISIIIKIGLLGPM